MAILSIQSQLAAGHVGNSVAQFALQRLGHEVWALPTVLLSNHPGQGATGGGVVPLPLLRRMLAGLRNHNGLVGCEVVLSGYLGQPGAAGLVRDAVKQVKNANPAAIYLCDPVLGDDERLYVSPEIVAKMHNLAKMADIMTPNMFELRLLTGHDCQTRAEAQHAMRHLQAQGPGIVLLTSLEDGTPAELLDVLALDGGSFWRLTVPRLDRRFSGAGDLLAALFVHFWLPRRDCAAALASACAGVHAVLVETAARGCSELCLLQAQLALEHPVHSFVPERLA